MKVLFKLHFCQNSSWTLSHYNIVCIPNFMTKCAQLRCKITPRQQAFCLSIKIKSLFLYLYEGVQKLLLSPKMTNTLTTQFSSYILPKRMSGTCTFHLASLQPLSKCDSKSHYTTFHGCLTMPVYGLRACNADYEQSYQSIKNCGSSFVSFF